MLCTYRFKDGEDYTLGCGTDFELIREISGNYHERFIRGIKGDNRKGKILY